MITITIAILITIAMIITITIMITIAILITITIIVIVMIVTIRNMRFCRAAQAWRGEEPSDRQALMDGAGSNSSQHHDIYKAPCGVVFLKSFLTVRHRL